VLKGALVGNGLINPTQSVTPRVRPAIEVGLMLSGEAHKVKMRPFLLYQREERCSDDRERCTIRVPWMQINLRNNPRGLLFYTVQETRVQQEELEGGLK